MKIGIDIQSTIGKKTGIGYYTENLLNNFTSSSDTNFLHYFNSSKHDLNSIQRMYWENGPLKSIAQRDSIDILHVPGFAGPLKKGKYKKITTVHDLIGIRFPGNLGVFSRFYWQKWLPLCVKNSDAIISVSENTKHDIINFLNVPEDRIYVVLSAADEKFIPIKNEKLLMKAAQKYHLPNEFVLCVGSVEPRKNICGLIKAFASYASKGNSNLYLVIAGKKDWGYKEALEKAKEMGISSKVIFTGYIEDEDLPLIYNLAKFFIFPSFYEGFGLPVLEAMACGKAVICSNVSSLPELAGTAALMIDPLKNEDIEEAIKKIDNDAVLRSELSSKALKQAERFSWKKTAAQTLEVYKKVYQTKQSKEIT